MAKSFTPFCPGKPVLIFPLVAADQPEGGDARNGPPAGPEPANCALLEVLAQMVWTASPEGNLDYISPWFYAFTGQQPGESLGWNWTAVLHPDDVQPSLGRWTHALRTGQPYQAEYRIKRGDGQYVWHLVKADPVRDQVGNVIRWVGVSVDVHEQKLREERLDSPEALEAKVGERTRDLLLKNTELVRANEALDSIVHIAGHDLRSPINNLKALLDIYSYTTGEAEKDQLMGFVQESVRRLDQTVAGLLRLLEAQHSNQSLVQTLSFAEALDIAMADYREDVANHGIHLLTAFHERPWVRYNETYLLSILRNLVSNAIKYRSPQRTLQLEISTRPAGELVCLSVKDNGIGMDPGQVRDKLFKPFSRISVQADGKGIGLHLVKNMVEKNGGHIRVETCPDAGTTFLVYLKEYE